MSQGWAPPVQLETAPHPAAAKFRSRRERLSAAHRGRHLVIPAGVFKPRANDSDYPFRPESNFVWLTGHSEPDSVLLMRAEGSGHTATLYIEPRADRSTPGFFTDARRGELWVGPRRGVPETQRHLQIECAPLQRLADDLQQLERSRTVALRGI